MTYKSAHHTARARGVHLGMNWIRQDKRLAIYLRDGCACAWCDAALEDGATLTLDHLRPHSKGGTNEETNLVTACKECNERRGAKGLRRFALIVAKERGLDATAICARIRRQAARSLARHRDAAARMIEQRGVGSPGTELEFAL